MKLLEYLGISTDELKAYIDSGMIHVDHHDQFPLSLFSYSREAQYENTWPEPVRKCRGLIVREDTEEIIARPFEKFFNLETDNLDACVRNMSGTGVVEESKFANIAREPDFIFEKMDGFMCTLYTWEGVNYIASKGSFKSTHAKWATAQYHKQVKQHKEIWPDGFTPVFEGITKNLRIVVDYGEREELVLIGLVDIETGEERLGDALAYWAIRNGFSFPAEYNLPLGDANKLSLNAETKNFEGYVAVWKRPGQTPFRLKIKYLDYLRIHRLVSGVSPKRVYEALVNGWSSEFDEWIDESTPWFSKFIAKWKNVLEGKYNELVVASWSAFTSAKIALWPVVTGSALEGIVNVPTRKQWADEFAKHPKELHSILFATLDGKDLKPYIWKRVKPLIRDSKPMIDAYKM